MIKKTKRWDPQIIPEKQTNSVWSRVVIETVPSLEVIEIGYLYYNSANFLSTPLELKSSIHRMEIINRPAQVEIVGLRRRSVKSISSPCA